MRDSDRPGAVNLTFAISGEGLLPETQVKRLTVTKVVDNQGRSALPGSGYFNLTGGKLAAGILTLLGVACSHHHS